MTKDAQVAYKRRTPMIGLLTWISKNCEFIGVVPRNGTIAHPFRIDSFQPYVPQKKKRK